MSDLGFVWPWDKQDGGEDMNQHTPGPWRKSAYDGGWDCVRDSGGQIIAKLGLNNPTNAHLIAAAPDMLEALKRLLRDDTIIDGWCDGFTDEFEGQVRAAIAKAEGKS